MKAEQSIIFTDVWAGYGQEVVLAGVSLNIQQGEFVVIIGPNGSGKSTLIKTILGLIPLTQGELVVAGYTGPNLPRARNKIGYLPQMTLVDPKFPVTAIEVVLMGSYSRLGLLARPGDKERTEAERCLAAVGLADHRNSLFGILSGGQRQRVLLARALMGSPIILLLDEPTTALDVAAQHDLVQLIANLNRRLELTVVMVTHDVNQVISFADKIGYLNRKLYAFGPPDQVLTSELLSQVYGSEVVVVDHAGEKRVVVGDHHA